MRALLAVLALTALMVGCGSSMGPSERGAPGVGSLESLWKQSGQSVGVSEGQDAPSVYVAHVRVNTPGKYYVLARPVGPVAIGGIRDVRYCSSRTCGPVVDVVDRVRSRFHGTAIRFIHVEIYQDNDPRKGENRWVREWHLPSEPWTFLVGRDGRVKAKFEGSVSSRELTSAVRRLLP